MYMPYSKNPHLPQARMRTVLLIRRGWSIRKAARHMGFSHSAVSRWLKIAPADGRLTIPTRSSRPIVSPRAINKELVGLIIAKRKSLRRCSEIVHASLKQEGIVVSLSTVKRTLRRYSCLKRRSKWARYRLNIKRPFAERPGDLVQLDTIHLQKSDGTRIYVFTLLDVVSRWGNARVVKRINTRSAIKFLKESQGRCPFNFKNIQTDHGPEFGKFFHDQAGLPHRYIRVRKPNDNAHLERFNRTIQDECLKYIWKEKEYRKEILKYLNHYNNSRMHLGLKLLTPMQMVSRS
jgi:transposase InsO family protein